MFLVLKFQNIFTETIDNKWVNKGQKFHGSQYSMTGGYNIP